MGFHPANFGLPSPFRSRARASISIQHWRTIDRGAEGAEVERRRRENRGALGAEGWSVGRGFPLPTGGAVWGGGSALSPENLSIADLKMVSFDAFCVVYTCVSYAEARNRYRLDICPSVCPSHAGTVSKRLNILSCFLHHTIAHSF